MKKILGPRNTLSWLINNLEREESVGFWFQGPEEERSGGGPCSGELWEFADAYRFTCAKIREMHSALAWYYAGGWVEDDTIVLYMLGEDGTWEPQTAAAMLSHLRFRHQLLTDPPLVLALSTAIRAHALLRYDARVARLVAQWRGYYRGLGEATTVRKVMNMECLAWAALRDFAGLEDAGAQDPREVMAEIRERHRAEMVRDEIEAPFREQWLAERAAAAAEGAAGGPAQTERQPADGRREMTMFRDGRKQQQQQLWFRQFSEKRVSIADKWRLDQYAAQKAADLQAARQVLNTIGEGGGVADCADRHSQQGDLNILGGIQEETSAPPRDALLSFGGASSAAATPSERNTPTNAKDRCICLQSCFCFSRCRELKGVRCPCNTPTTVSSSRSSADGEIINVTQELVDLDKTPKASDQRASTSAAVITNRVVKMSSSSSLVDGLSVTSDSSNSSLEKIGNLDYLLPTVYKPGVPAIGLAIEITDDDIEDEAQYREPDIFMGPPTIVDLSHPAASGKETGLQNSYMHLPKGDVPPYTMNYLRKYGPPRDSPSKKWAASYYDTMKLQKPNGSIYPTTPTGLKTIMIENEDTESAHDTSPPDPCAFSPSSETPSIHLEADKAIDELYSDSLAPSGHGFPLTSTLSSIAETSTNPSSAASAISATSTSSSASDTFTLSTFAFGQLPKPMDSRPMYQILRDLQVSPPTGATSTPRADDLMALPPLTESGLGVIGRGASHGNRGRIGESESTGAAKHHLHNQHHHQHREHHGAGANAGGGVAEPLKVSPGRKWDAEIVRGARRLDAELAKRRDRVRLGMRKLSRSASPAKKGGSSPN